MYADRTSEAFKLVFGNNTDDTFTSKTGNYPATGLKQIGNQYDDSGLPVITAQINPAMLNPGGRSLNFDEFNPTSVFTPASYYSYTPMSASVVRKMIPLLAGADMVDFFPKANTNTVLPLDLIAFDAKIDNSLTAAVKLTWTTTNEINTKDFELSRKGESGDFIKIHTEAAKNTSGFHQYSFIDKNPEKGLNYYQLKQNDNNGKFTFSQVVFVRNSLESVSTLSVYPNPAEQTLNINYALAAVGANLKVLGLDGKTIFQKEVTINSSVSSLDVSKLATGTYLLVLDNNNEKSSIKFIKQ